MLGFVRHQHPGEWITVQLSIHMGRCLIRQLTPDEFNQSIRLRESRPQVLAGFKSAAGIANMQPVLKTPVYGRRGCGGSTKSGERR